MSQEPGKEQIEAARERTKERINRDRYERPLVKEASTLIKNGVGDDGILSRFQNRGVPDHVGERVLSLARRQRGAEKRDTVFGAIGSFVGVVFRFFLPGPGEFGGDGGGDGGAGA